MSPYCGKARNPQCYAQFPIMRSLWLSIMGIACITSSVALFVI